MIITQRGFQSNSKIITAGDEMLETLINMKNVNTTASYDFALMGRFFYGEIFVILDFINRKYRQR